MDIGTGIALLGSAKVLEKVLGPTAEYLGTGIQTFAKKRVENIASIFRRSAQRLEGATENEGMPADPLMLRSILDYGSFINDELIQEYLAGLLISSRSDANRDNRSAIWARTVEQMSTYQIRTHYLFYSIIRKLYLGTNANIGLQAIREKHQTYLSLPLYTENVLEGKEEELFNLVGIVQDTVHGLERLGLIGTNFVFGSIQSVNEYSHSVKAELPGIVMQPSVFGAQLFLGISGSKEGANEILSQEAKIPELVEIKYMNGQFFNMPYE
jgi:hypothetical protein